MERKVFFVGEKLETKFGSWEILESYRLEGKAYRYYKIKCLKCGAERVVTTRIVSNPAAWCSECNKAKYRALLDEGIQQCRKCHRQLPFSAFRERKNCKGGINHTCKECEIKYTKDPEYLANWEADTKICKRCKKTKSPTKDFWGYPASADGLMYWCKACWKERWDERRLLEGKPVRDPEKKLREKYEKEKLREQKKNKNV